MFGVLAGLTVYAVPQVLAATTPAGLVAIQVGTLVKLVRVLMLGPVLLGLGSVAGRLRADAASFGPGAATLPGIALRHVVPWFIVGFLIMVGLRSSDLLPAASLGPIAVLANVLTLMSMAALGLGVDIRMVARAGARVTLAVTLSLVALAAISFVLIRLLGIA